MKRRVPTRPIFILWIRHVSTAIMRNVVSSEIEKISRHIISHNCMLILCISKGRACRQDGRSVHHVRDMCSDGPAITRFAEAESI